MRGSRVRGRPAAARRRARAERTSAETTVAVAVDLDGEGRGRIRTTVPFLDHMLTLLSRHSQIDVEVTASGDTDVDYHHLVEDVGIVMGQAVRQAVGTARGIERFGSAVVPIDEALAVVAVDISGRGHLSTGGAFDGCWIRDFDLTLLEEFLRALAMHAGITLHARLLSGVNAHHRAEAVFKGLARALRDATRINPRVRGVPSTKGRIDGIG